MCLPSGTWSASCLRPQTVGSVAAKTVDPVKLLIWGLERLQQNLVQWFSNEHTNLLSCINLDVENLHSAVHDKNKVSTPLQYARDLGARQRRSLNERLIDQRIIILVADHGIHYLNDHSACSISLQWINLPQVKPLLMNPKSER